MDFITAVKGQKCNFILDQVHLHLHNVLIPKAKRCMFIKAFIVMRNAEKEQAKKERHPLIVKYFSECVIPINYYQLKKKRR